MSIFGSMKTAVSGMSAQANRLSTVSDNIANANTTGYKAVSTSFSSLVLPSSSGNYNSGGVQTSAADCRTNPPSPRGIRNCFCWNANRTCRWK
ncbi:flagellar hook-basal body protein [Rhizobium beringeri]|jgi:flagellar hook-basal body protein